MITIHDLKVPEKRKQFMDAYLADPKKGTLSDRTRQMGIFSSRTPDSPADYIVSNLDALAPDGSPTVPEVWQAVEACEVGLSWTPGSLPAEMQLGWLRDVRSGMGQERAHVKWANIFKNGEDSEEADGAQSSPSTLEFKTVAELLSFYTPERLSVLEEQPWLMAGHPGFEIEIVLPDRLPLAGVVVGEGLSRTAAWILLYMLQEGVDILGWPITWNGHHIDHIDPASEGYELCFGNAQLLRKYENSRKSDLPLQDYLSMEVERGIITLKFREDIVSLNAERRRDAQVYMDWQIEQTRKSQRQARLSATNIADTPNEKASRKDS